jgi:hypothetical protein
MTAPAPNHRGMQTKPRNGNDEAAREALAMAAVAQAANASNKSPAEVAQLAKAQAQNLAKQKRPPPRPEPRKIYTVDLESIKSLLRSEIVAEVEDYGAEDKPMSNLLSKLADGQNDPFLQQLLLFEYYRAVVQDDSSTVLPAEDTGEHNMTSSACDKMKTILGVLETAYDTMATMLPPNAPDQVPPQPLMNDDDLETPKVVPDLLPLCTSKPGDPTLLFFKACMGEGPAPNNETTLEDAHNHEDTATEATDLDEASQEPFDEHNKHAPSVFSMFRRGASLRNTKLAAVFGGRNRKKESHDDEADREHDSAACGPGEYSVKIEREMLGLTVENVLERTVVRTVLAGGPAKKAGAKVGSLIVKVGNIETRNLTHFETIDELRQSQRPLQLMLRQISDDSLRSAREEMGRLIRGSGFGKIIDGGDHPHPPQQQQQDTTTAAENGPSTTITTTITPQKPKKINDKNIAIYTSVVRKRWIEAVNHMTPRSRKDEPILRVGEKLIWIMTLFVVGLERESVRLLALAKGKEDQSPRRSSHSQYHHTAKDYADAARSVSKILYDFVKKRMDAIQKTKQQQHQPPGPPNMSSPGRQGPRGGPIGRGGRGRGRGRGDAGRGESVGDQLLLQIGDMLQRTRTFLADPTSPPAALLRGELIAILCDILDADTEMKLSEEEMSSTQGGSNAGPIADLGAAGSLLKLIVLNCPIMRSPGCEEIFAEHNHIDESEMKRRFGEIKAISGDDFHRLHAGNRFLAVVHRLAASRSTSARITACSLGPVLWSHLDFPHQLQVGT